jgi:type VI secretion system protein ImpK
MASSFVQTVTDFTLDHGITRLTRGVSPLQDLATDLFMIAIRMHEADDLGPPEALRKLIKHYIALYEKNAATMGVSREKIETSKYAIVALLDETVLSTPGPCRDYWMVNPLQLEYFGDNLAGEVFFKRLDKVMASAEKMKDVLEIYYLCLSLGFQGKYRIGASADRDSIIARVAEALKASGKDGTRLTLSPHGQRVSLMTRDHSRRPLAFPPVWILATVAGVALTALWGTLAYLAGTHARELLGRF